MRFRPMVWAAYAITLLLGVKLYMSSAPFTLGANDHGQLANSISQSFQFLKNKDERINDIVTGATPTPEKKKEPEGPSADSKEAKKTETPAAPSTADAEGAVSESAKNPGSDAEQISIPETPDSEKTLLQRLAARRATLEEREKALLEREALAAAAEQRLEARIAELKNADAELKTAQEAHKAEQSNLKPLVVMYEAMKPKDAARIFEKLQLADLLPVAQAMNPRKLSDILAQIDPAIAGRISVGLVPSLRKVAGTDPTGAVPELPDLPVKAR